MRTITSNRLRLRPWRDDDADFLLDLESRWEVVRFLGAHPTTMRTREDALASIARRRAIDDPIHGIWANATAADDRLVGNLLLKPIPLSAGEPSGRPNDVEIGWHLHPDACGHGYATEAAEAVLDDAFSQGLTKVLAVTDPDNHASSAPGIMSAAKLRLNALTVHSRLVIDAPRSSWIVWSAGATTSWSRATTSARLGG